VLTLLIQRVIFTRRRTRHRREQEHPVRRRSPLLR